MRTIVIASLPETDIGAVQIEWWARIAIPDNVTKPGRQAYYARQSANVQPSAPPHADPVKQNQEVSDIQAGKYVERYMGVNRYDPTLTNAQLRAMLANILADEVAKYTAYDDARLGKYGTSLDDQGNTWTAGVA